MTPDAFAAELRACLALLNAGQAAAARPRIERLIATRPEQPDPYALLGLALEQQGDAAGGEAQLRRAIAINPRQPQYPFQLARLLARAGRPEAAAEAYRAHLALAPGHAPARHDLGAALLDAGDAEAAEAELRAALRQGHDAPETWLVLGRALELQGRYEAAEDAYRASIGRRPSYADAHRDLAQLVWRRTQDARAAAAALDAALAAAPDPELTVQKAKLLEAAGEPTAALATLAAALTARPETPLLLAAMSQAALALDPAKALAWAERAAALAAGDPVIQITLSQAQLASGDAAGAERSARAAMALAPLDQQAIALLDTARRLAGDDRRAGGDLLVRTYRLAAPPPWTDLESFLVDLRVALEARHQLGGQPIGQSTRGGGEASLDPRTTEPVLAAFFRAIRAPIARHIADLGPGDDAFRRRATGDFRLAGAWSVRLRPGGYHASHVHPRGWISSAFYVALPKAMDADADKAGWLQFGQPGPPTQPALRPEHFVQPEPGLLALFPSYLWHGTVPFEGAEPRLTVAFDVVPA